MIPDRSIHHVALALVLVFAVAAQDVATIGQQPAFHSRSNTVLVPALVKDRNGEIIYGLEAEDFIIDDDGVEQPVHMDNLPESTPVSLVICIQLGRTAGVELPRIRTLGTMLDPIMSQGRNRVAIVSFDNEVELVRGFTTNSALIAGDLRQLHAGDHHRAVMLEALGYSVSLLTREPKERQRILLLVSETRDHGSLGITFEDVVQIIADSDTTIYALAFSPPVSDVLDTLRGNTGKEKKPPPPQTDASTPEITRGDVLANGSRRGGLAFQGLVAMAAGAMRQNTPKTIAEMTGGEYELFTSRTSFESRMTEFANHLHNRYLLSFEPKDPHPGLHKIRVRLRQSGNASVIVRDRYWAGPPSQD